MIHHFWRIIQVEAEVEINGTPCVITLDVKKTSAKNHFWIHYIRIEKKDSALLTSAPGGQKINETQNLSNERIADEVEGVKHSIETEDLEELQRKHENTLR